MMRGGLRWCGRLAAAWIALTAVVCGEVMSPPSAGLRIALIGSGLGEQLQYDGQFETLLRRRHPEARLVLRNLCVPGDTPAWRPRSGRTSPWAFPGAESLRADSPQHRGDGVEPSPDEWLALCKADMILAFFGWNESFDGPDAVAGFTRELRGWIDHTRGRRYNGRDAPVIVLVSPIAFEDHSAGRDLPDGTEENRNLQRITDAMRAVAVASGVACIDVFTPSLARMESGVEPLTSNGFLPNEVGNRWLAQVLADALFGSVPVRSQADSEALRRLVIDKDRHWRDDCRIPNGVHVYGRRREPFGMVNYPQEIEKLRQLTANRDEAIHAMVAGMSFDLAAADARTRALDPVPTNVRHDIHYRSGEEALQAVTMMDGFRIGLFACERRFPELRNPVQMTFDHRGRLWVAVMPSYPHHKPGDPPPDDKILIFEDQDEDGRADTQTVFADRLHLPTGFTLRYDGVYLSAQPGLMRLRDSDGDDVADVREWILHGFDTHDTHHAISTFAEDPSGGIHLLEGTFLHSNVETAYGPCRDSGSGVWRFDPRAQRLERISQTAYYNPWGLVLDDWGQPFLNDASSGETWWMLPLSVRTGPGRQLAKVAPIQPRRTRPTCGAELVSSRHFPDELQGAFLTHNVIGFLGTSVHRLDEDGSGFIGRHVGDLISSSDPNFRLVDLEFAPDGSLFVLDWHNALIGHMQHSARDPKRDREHGRIYRVTHATRPLVRAPVIAEASVEQLIQVLEESESRTRQRARSELRGRKSADVMPAVRAWAASLDPADPRHDRHACEALWVSCGFGTPDDDLLRRCLRARSHQARAAAVGVIRNDWRHIPDHAALLMEAAHDAHPRVRLAAIVAASWIGGSTGASIVVEALKQPVDRWMRPACEEALETLKPFLGNAQVRVTGGDDAVAPPSSATEDPTGLTGEPLRLYRLGREVYQRDAHCATCHRADGIGDGIYPPLAGSAWVTGSEERLIKLALKGVWGAIEVGGKSYDPGRGVPPMPGFEPMLGDEELAAVLTYVRHRFGNRSAPVTPQAVGAVRKSVVNQQGFYTVEELLREHPMER